MTQLAISALPSGEPTAELGSTQYLTVLVGDEVFALPIGSVREVLEFSGMTAVPTASPVVPGVVNLRGAVVPVLQLSARFGRAASEISRRTCIVVAEALFDDGVQPIGVIVDAVREAIEVEANRIESRPPFGSGIRADFVSGLLRLQNGFVVVLDMKNVLSVPELEHAAI